MPTTFEIHPSIGISRVGASEQFFLGPGPDVPAPARYRDETGRLLRQAARFRVFECERDASGQLVSFGEVGPERGEVEWTVHVANRKAEGELSPPPPSRQVQEARRNAGHANRDELIIDPGPRSLRGPGQAAPFDSGRFLGAPVALGEAQTDADGRLVVVGGFGTSSGPPEELVTFSNNDRWRDDISDGPVRASVTLAGSAEPVQAEPAWVVVAPPDFAPAITNFVTLYDVAFQAAVERGWLTVAPTPSFTRDILPILSRAVGYRWVIQLARVGHGSGRRGDFTDAARLSRLADPAAPRSLRQAVFERLRNPRQSDAAVEPGSMPRLHDETNSEAVLMPTESQYTVLERWVAGSFVNDLGQPSAPEPLPDAMTRLSLEACAGGPFFPGIEVGRIMADPASYGSELRLDADRLRPGDVTQGNAVPWQADFLLCRFGDRTELGWWPAQRPDKVLVDTASRTTKRWVRGVEAFSDMVEHWHELGVVVPARGPDGEAVFVESERLLPSS
jgi:L-lysine epsilon oxidase-like protein